MKFQVTAFSSITGKWFVISRHATMVGAEKAARRASRWQEVKIEEIA